MRKQLDSGVLTPDFAAEWHRYFDTKQIIEQQPWTLEDIDTEHESLVN